MSSYRPLRKRNIRSWKGFWCKSMFRHWSSELRRRLRHLYSCYTRLPGRRRMGKYKILFLQ